MEELLHQLRDRGYCRINGVFSKENLSDINQKIDLLITDNWAGNVKEKDSEAVRGIHGPHLREHCFRELFCRDAILDICKSHLGEDVYIHQYKINMKQAMEGRAWPWHQDFVYWREFDFIAEPRLLNVMVALDDVSLLHGPLCFIPHSHKFGDLNAYSTDLKASWQQAVSADLNFQIERPVISRLLDQFDAEFITAKAGDIIFFDPQLAHCSSNNMSAGDRRLMIVTVNALSNKPLKKSGRPAFLAADTYEPLQTMATHD